MGKPRDLQILQRRILFVPTLSLDNVAVSRNEDVRWVSFMMGRQAFMNRLALVCVFFFCWSSEMAAILCLLEMDVINDHADNS